MHKLRWLFFVNPIHLISSGMHSEHSKQQSKESDHYNYICQNSRGYPLWKLFVKHDWSHYNNKYVIFYSLWPSFVHLLVESHSDQMYFYFCCFVIILIMSWFDDDDDDFSLSGLMQQWHKLDVTVNSSY